MEESLFEIKKRPHLLQGSCWKLEVWLMDGIGAGVGGCQFLWQNWNFVLQKGIELVQSMKCCSSSSSSIDEEEEEEKKEKKGCIKCVFSDGCPQKNRELDIREGITFCREVVISSFN